MSRKSIEGRLRRDAYGAATPPLETPHQSMALTKHACVLWGGKLCKKHGTCFYFQSHKGTMFKKKKHIRRNQSWSVFLTNELILIVMND